MLATRSTRRTVIVPGYTCPLVVLAARAAGLRVVACDTRPDRFDIDLARLDRLIAADTLCVVPTHLGGWLTDLPALRVCLAARDPAIVVIEDAAQAFGARWHGTSIGLAGDIGVFSFAAGKGLTLWEGGALVSTSHEHIRDLRQTAGRLQQRSRSFELENAMMLAAYHAVYNPLGLRLAYGAPKRRRLARGDDIGAAGDRFEAASPVAPVGRWRRAVGRRALDRLDAHLAAARSTFALLAERLSALPQLVVHVPPPHAEPGATFLIVTLPDTPAAAAIADRLWRSRLGVSRLFTRAIVDYPELAGMIEAADTPNARALARRTLILSTAAFRSGQAMETMVQAFLKIVP